MKRLEKLKLSKKVTLVDIAIIVLLAIMVAFVSLEIWVISHFVAKYW